MSECPFKLKTLHLFHSQRENSKCACWKLMCVRTSKCHGHIFYAPEKNSKCPWWHWTSLRPGKADESALPFDLKVYIVPPYSLKNSTCTQILHGLKAPFTPLVHPENSKGTWWNTQLGRESKSVTHLSFTPKKLKILMAIHSHSTSKCHSYLFNPETSQDGIDKTKLRFDLRMPLVDGTTLPFDWKCHSRSCFMPRKLKRKREGARRYIVSLVRSKVFLIHRNE